MKTTAFSLLAVMVACTARADFTPVPLTPGSFNQDIVVENTATPPVGRSTTATMDAGTNNTGNTWYEVGFNLAAPTTGIPAAGSTFTHQTLADHSYTMAASFAAPNAVLIAPNQVSSNTIVLATPAPYSNLSLLAAGGNGGITINYTIHFADATTQTGTLPIGDWFNGANPAWTANGRLNAATFAVNTVNGNNPRLYGFDIPLSNTGSPVTSMDVTYASGTGRIGIFALSGAPVGGGNWSPIAITGYNYDMIVEASAPQPSALTTATTASMDGGTNNTGNTWFERGYDPSNPTVGLPVAGSTFASLALPDHSYTMPASYTAPNAVMVDSNNPTANLTLASPAAYTTLSFLGASANGNVTNQVIIQHADGSSETQTFVARDWFNNAPVAFNANGRVNLADRSLNNINAGNPRLYEAQLPVPNTSSPITNVVLTWIGGSATSRAIVFALSGTTGPVPPLLSGQPQSIGVFEGSNIVFSVTLAGGSPPLTFQWQRGTNGVFVNIADGANLSGATTSNLSITNVAFENAGEYRVVVTNQGGSAISAVATLSVLSALQDVTAAGDPITGFGGSAPAAEDVPNAINNVLQKYLNFGSGPNPNGAPFVGPVGLVVTPAVGGTRVNALRFYTANDAPERDPADYKLEGSLDGGNTWTLISSNALALPAGRNGSGTTPIDPFTQFIQEVRFSNAVAYSSYRLTFSRVKNPTAANSMQIAEVEFLGVAAPVAPVLTITREAGGVVRVTSTADAFLQTATELLPTGTDWQDYDFIAAGPAGLTFTPLPGEKLFFRARLATP